MIDLRINELFVVGVTISTIYKARCVPDPNPESQIEKKLLNYYFWNTWSVGSSGNIQLKSKQGENSSVWTTVPLPEAIWKDRVR